MPTLINYLYGLSLKAELSAAVIKFWCSLVADHLDVKVFEVALKNHQFRFENVE